MRTEQLYDAFALHERTYGRLDVLLNNAGVAEKGGQFTEDVSRDGKSSWRKNVSINLTATIDGTRLGVSGNRGSCKLFSYF